jgi:uncharacterized protein (TIGR02271 family)
MAALKQRTVIVGVFEDRRHADQAVADLLKAGFRQDQIGVAMRHAEGTEDETTVAHDSHAGSGALTGALTGLGLGALAGLGVLSGFIPVVGPAIAAGTLGVVLSNAAAGAGIVGLTGALIGAGVPEHEATYYQGEFEAGRAIVTVHADSRGDEATAILRRDGAYDMTNRGESVVATAVGTPTSSRATGTPVGTAAGRTTSAKGGTIEVKEERLRAEKTPVNTGEVRVRKDVHTETQTIDVPVEREEIVIERSPGRGRATSDTLRPGEEIRIPVSEEKVRVVKDAVVTEEVTVGKRTVKDTEHVSGQVRKEEVKVEQTGNVDVRTKGSKNT